MHAKYAVANCVNETHVFYRDICIYYQPKKILCLKNFCLRVCLMWYDTALPSIHWNVFYYLLLCCFLWYLYSNSCLSKMKMIFMYLFSLKLVLFYVLPSNNNNNNNRLEFSWGNHNLSILVFLIDTISIKMW